MNPSPITQIFSLTLTLWIVGLALFRMTNCHKWYLKTTKAVFVTPIKGACKSIWKNHWKLIVGFAAGVVFCLWLSGFFNG